MNQPPFSTIETQGVEEAILLVHANMQAIMAAPLEGEDVYKAQLLGFHLLSNVRYHLEKRHMELSRVTWDSRIARINEVWNEKMEKAWAEIGQPRPAEFMQSGRG